jgi:hypothetical protein
MERGGGSGMTFRRRTGSKFNNQKTEWQGETFDSGLELNRWLGLCQDEKDGKITELRRQVRYDFQHNGVLLGWYIADHVYRDAAGELVVEDVKGYRVKGWGKQKKHMLAFHGIAVQEWPPREPRPQRRKARPCPDCGVEEGFMHLGHCELLKEGKGQ